MFVSEMSTLSLQSLPLAFWPVVVLVRYGCYEKCLALLCVLQSWVNNTLTEAECHE